MLAACKSGNAAVVQALIDVGAEVNATADDGETALSLAEYFRHEDSARVIREAVIKKILAKYRLKW